jgi:hypothetical protein
MRKDAKCQVLEEKLTPHKGNVWSWKLANWWLFSSNARTYKGNVLIRELAQKEEKLQLLQKQQSSFC